MNIKVRIYLISRFCAYVVPTKNIQEIIITFVEYQLYY